MHSGKILIDGQDIAGTHAALMNKNGLYAQMWNMQVGGFLPEMPIG